MTPAPRSPTDAERAGRAPAEVREQGARSAPEDGPGAERRNERPADRGEQDTAGRSPDPGAPIEVLFHLLQEVDP